MPKITLKPNSPEFEEHKPVKPRGQARCCDMPGCRNVGEHRAPKDRSLSEYYWFCHTHVQEYNAAWDFFSGMGARDIEQHIIESFYGDRPTWRSDTYRGLESELQRRIHETYTFQDAPEPDDVYQARRATGNPELDALAMLGLEPPITFARIKVRYRELVKKYHPDRNQADPRAEDLIKRINMAYTLLKMTYREDESRDGSF